MNIVILSGNLVRNIELKYSANGTPYITNCIAVKKNTKNENGEYDTDFINVSFFGVSAEYVNNYCKKGSKVLINGILTTGSYVNKEGKKIVVTNVIANSIEVINSNNNKETASKNTDNPSAAIRNSQAPSYNTEGFGAINIEDDADLPF